MKSFHLVYSQEEKYTLKLKQSSSTKVYEAMIQCIIVLPAKVNMRFP